VTKVLGVPLTDDRLRMEQGRLAARIRKLSRKRAKVGVVAVAVLELIVVERVMALPELERVVLEEDTARGEKARKALRSVSAAELRQVVERLSPSRGIVLPAGVRL
jgi:hypothetical protein